MAKGDFPHVAVNKAKEAVKKLYPHSPYLDYCLELVDKAQNLAQPEDEQEALSDLEAIKMLGEGWVAEETLAIALYCSLKYLDDENGFEKAIVASVNHDGDSDSTGAVTGNIMGAVLGIKNIPQKFIEGL